MNKQEAIKRVEQMGEYERFVDEPVSKKSVLNIISQIDEPVEKEKLYTVEIPNNGGTLVLARVHQSIKLVDGDKRFPGKFTKKLIENAGFGWVLKWAKPVEDK